MPELNSLYPILYLGDSILAVVISILILSKDPKYYLNRLFAAMVFIFGNYFFWASMQYFFYSDMWFVNLFKDLSVFSSHVASFIFFVAGMMVWKGRDNTSKPVIAVSAILGLSVSIFALLDERVLPIETSVEFTRTPGIGHLATYGGTLVFVALGFYYFFKVYQMSEDKAIKQKVGFFLLAMGLIVLGIIYFALYRLVGLIDLIGPFADVIGCVFLSTGMLFILLAFWKN